MHLIRGLRPDPRRAFHTKEGARTEEVSILSNLAVVGLGDCVHAAVARLSPAVEEIGGPRVRAVPLWPIPPRHPGAQNPEDAIEDAPTVLARGPVPTARQHQLDRRLREIRAIVAIACHGSPACESMATENHRTDSPIKACLENMA